MLDQLRPKVAATAGAPVCGKVAASTATAGVWMFA